jgi:RNA polymerase sigma-70 factor (ECF subfamily)
VSNQQTEFANFFQASWAPCLRAVVAVVGSQQLAEDQVAEAFAKAWVSWRKVRRHPAPRAWCAPRSTPARRGGGGGTANSPWLTTT